MNKRVDLRFTFANNNIFSKSKRSQISIFVIIAIVFVAILLIYFVIKGNLITNSGINSEIKPIYNYVDNCLEKTAEDAIYTIGQNGGYFIYANKSNEIGIPYYFDREENLMPSKEQVGKELEKYINDMMFFCTKNFVEFPDYNIKYGEIKTKVEINRDETIFNLNYPLSINKGENNFVLENFNKVIPSRLNTIYKVAEEIIKEQMLEKNNICINCIGDISFENKVFVSMNDYTENEIIFSIRDNEIGLKGEEYVYYFVNRYDIE